MNQGAYAGIGSRRTSPEIQNLMIDIARFLCGREMILRSGGAEGADKAFEGGVLQTKMKEIYLPWPKFNGSTSDIWLVSPEAFELAERYHPAWNDLGGSAQRLIARNGYQILGEDLKTPARFVVCWTKDGRASGGTGQGIRIANDRDIPVLNLFKKKDVEHVKECMKTHQIFA